MIDRIEEYRRDWVSGPAPKTPRKLFPPERPLRVGAGLLFFLLLALAGGAFVLHGWRRQVERAAKDEMCSMKTRLELSSQLRLLRQYYLSNGGLPESPTLYLQGFMQDNKPYPRGCDFWGHPYQVDSYFDYIGVRSAGRNGKMNDLDDLVMGFSPKQINPDH